MPETYDAIVLGLGAMGAAATYQLAKRGAKVLGIDQYAPPHEFGSTHGDTRITRIACGEGPEYSAFAARSHEIWRELEAKTGLDLLTQNGFLAISGAGQRSANHGVAKFLDATVAAAKAGETLFEIGRRNQVAIPTSCVGKASCGLCRVVIVAGEQHLTPMGPLEKRHLGNVYFITKQRLSCQTRLVGDDADVTVRLL